MAKDDKPTATEKGKGKATDASDNAKAPSKTSPEKASNGDKKDKKDEAQEGMIPS